MRESVARNRKRPTIVDVARAAKTSHATVSRYLNHSGYVSSGAAKAIDRAVAEIGYVPNRTARSLVNRSTQAVAFIVREHPTLFFSDPNLSMMAVGANAVLSAAGYQMFILIVDDDVSLKRTTDLIRGGFVDGAILVAMLRNDPIVTTLATASTPLVTASVPVEGSSIPYADTDNREAEMRISALLSSTGRKRIAEIRGPISAPVSQMRHQGFVEAMGTAYDARLVASAEAWTVASGAEAMRRILSVDEGVDGVVVASDLLAVGAVDVLGERGLRVPDDVGVVGFDDSPWALRTQPKLSTVRQDARETGRRMATIVLRQIDGEDLAGYRDIVPSRVVWRDSAGPRPVASTP